MEFTLWIIHSEAESKKTWCIGTHSRVDSNTFTMDSHIPESTLTLCQSRLYPPVRDLCVYVRLHILYSYWKVLIGIGREDKNFKLKNRIFMKTTGKHTTFFMKE